MAKDNSVKEKETKVQENASQNVESPEEYDFLQSAKEQPKRNPSRKWHVKFSSFEEDGCVKGNCTVTYNNMIAIKGVKVIEGSKGLFVAMPSFRLGDEYKDLVHPITKEGRQAMNEAVLAAYETQSQQMSDQQSGQQDDQGMVAAPEGVALPFE